MKPCNLGYSAGGSDGRVDSGQMCPGPEVAVGNILLSANTSSHLHM